MEKEKSRLITIIDTIVKYQVILTGLVFYIGFIFAQGTMMNDGTALIDVWYRSNTSISLKTYLVYGIAQILPLSFGVFATLGIFVLLRVLFSLSRIKKFFIDIKNFLKINENDLNSKGKPKSYDVLFLILLLAEICISLKFVMGWMFGKLLVSNNQLISYIILIFIYAIIYFTYEKFNNFKLSGQLISIKKFIEITLYLYIPVSLTLFIYNQGTLSILNKIADYSNGVGSVKMSIIETEIGSQTYMPIDDSSDKFIGYDSQNKSVVEIPNDKIKKITTTQVQPREKLKKYYADSQNNKTVEGDVANLIFDYYKYGVYKNTRDTEKYIEMLSKQYYREGYKSIPAELLMTKWSRNNKYRDNNLEEFLGYQIAVPQKNEGQYEVVVIEYFLNTNIYTKFIVKSEEGLWKIDNILITTPFYFE